MSRLLALLTTYCMTFTSIASAEAQTTEVINVAAALRSGDTIRGPITITLRNINRLRYNTRIVRQSTTVPLDLSLSSLLGSSSQLSGATPGTPFREMPRTVTDELATLGLMAFGAADSLRQSADSTQPGGDRPSLTVVSIANDFSDAISAVLRAYEDWETIQDAIRVHEDSTRAAAASLNNLVLSSDHILTIGGASALLTRIGRSP